MLKTKIFFLSIFSYFLIEKKLNKSKIETMAKKYESYGNMISGIKVLIGKKK